MSIKNVNVSWRDKLSPQEEAAQEIAERLAGHNNLSTDEVRDILVWLKPQELITIMGSNGVPTGYIGMGHQDPSKCIRDFFENRLMLYEYTTSDLQDAKSARKLVDGLIAMLAFEVKMSAYERKKQGLPPIKTNTSETLLILASMIICRASDIGVMYSGNVPHIVTRIYETDGSFSGVWQVLPNNSKAGDASSPLISMIYNLIYTNPKASLAKDIDAAVRAEIFNRANTEKYARPNAINNNLIFANNGVIDLTDNKTFTPYTSEEYMTKYDPYYTPLRKLDTNFVPTAVPPPYFDPMAFINSLFVRNTPADIKIADTSVRILLYAMQFTIRGFSGLTSNGIFLKNTADALTSDDRSGLRGAGKNGKSTFMELLCNLISHDSDAYLRNNPPELNVGGTGGNRIMRVDAGALDKSFSLNPDDMRLAYLMVSDDPDTGKAWGGSEYLKNILRGQPVRAERKFCDSEALPLRGTLFVATNGETNFASKDTATTTHQIHLNFTKRFNGADCDPNIKNVYIAKKDVLECLLKMLVDLPYADDFAPEDLAALGSNIKALRLYNSPTQAFFEEIFREIPYGRIPTDYIYEMYKAFCEKNGERPLGRRLFNQDLAAWISEHSDAFGFDRKRGRLSGYERIWLASHPWEALADYGTDKRGVPIECCNTHTAFDNFASRYTFATWFREWSLTDKRYSSFVICYPMLALMETSEKAGRTPWYDISMERLWKRLTDEYTDPNRKNYKDFTPYTEKDIYKLETCEVA